ALGAAALAAVWLLRGRGEGGGATAAAPAFVGTAACASCHQAEHAAWRGSQHDLAMQEPTQESVLGDFDDATFTYAGITTTFRRRDGAFVVRTDGPDGELRD